MNRSLLLLFTVDQWSTGSLNGLLEVLADRKEQFKFYAPVVMEVMSTPGSNKYQVSIKTRYIDGI